MAAQRALRFLWWNLESFAHYEAGRKNTDRWPDSQAAYAEKRGRIGRVIRQLFGDDPPEVLAFAEVTNKAAVSLRDTFFPGYEVLSLDLVAKPDFDVAILYRTAFATFEEQQPLAISEMPRGTRPMAVLDHLSPGNRIRIYACHWTARFKQTSNRWREDLASGLNRSIYRLLNDKQSGEVRHVLVVGDLNEEPWGEPLVGRMYASRDRAPSRRPAHYTDHDIQRVRLYNCSWRFLGERYPHAGGDPGSETAGTLYWQEEGTWHTFDHVLASGSLLSSTLPFLDEQSLRVLSSPLLLDPGGKPAPFEWNGGNPTGISDHLPISGRIVLERGNDHEQL